MLRHLLGPTTASKNHYHQEDVGFSRCLSLRFWKLILRFVLLQKYLKKAGSLCFLQNVDNHFFAELLACA